jgi:Fe-S cluster biogenesis protein NfuA
MSEIQKKVEKALDEVRPNIQADGGDIELVSVQNGVVKVRLQGHCVGCPMSAMTLKMGIENHLKERVPEIVKVESVQ